MPTHGRAAATRQASRRRANKVCANPTCPTIIPTGGPSRCNQCRSAADRARGTAHQRGYTHTHTDVFRAEVLARDPVCVLGCGQPSEHADHWPLSRRELVAAHLNPNDPQHGRGLCDQHHRTETARLQPGGWNQR